MIKLDEATQAQNAAADPVASTWVSANAGSGKTRVLTDRVARLLLHGTDPQKILCLTYTNAAAAEMQNRLFKRLGMWAMMQSADLKDALIKLGEDKSQLTEQKLRHARTLFATALETPGGLKIQTIHSFCDALLRQFPLEAHVSPQFEILEDNQAKQVRSDILEHLAESDVRPAFERLAEFYTGFDPDSLLQAIARNHRGFARRPTKDDFGLMPDMTVDSIARHTVNASDIDVLTRMAPILFESSVNDEKLGRAFQVAIEADDDKIRLQFLINCMLNKDRFEAKTSNTPTKAVREEHPDLVAKLHDLMVRVETAREAFVSAGAFTRAIILYDFARPFLDAYNTYKLLHGKLDYQDLIEKSQKLLKKNSMSQWILYRLDGGIDHILVDEAQDTSPDQWRLIECLTEEFTSGQGASDKERTVFVVGDEKQSIYSFQGADPKYFGEMRDLFFARLEAIETKLHKQDLLFSFRSAAPILNLVDQTFVGDARKGIIGDVLHRTFKTTKPGRVELWPLIEAASVPEDQPWYEPLDRPSESDPRQELAVKIATWIDTTIQEGRQIGDGDDLRPVRAGDFLILVQKRSFLFRAIIKELKSRGLNVAGADRLKVGDELAVKDVLSLLKFAATPEDDLSLAEVMRSPLLNITEGELFALAYGRKATLWQSLRDHKDRFETAKIILDEILAKADWMRPFELIDRILTLHKGRENLLDRLGEEAEDGIDELLSQAMRYEQIEAPTLTGFLNWFSSGKVEIKREMDSAAGQIRVMTVHASKGLEAPIVILPDTVSTRSRNDTEIVPLATDLIGWKSRKEHANQAERLALEAQKELDKQERLRLLYVAMTRAENWLVICGAGKLGKTGDPWYRLVLNGMESAGATKSDHGLVLQNEFWSEECKKSEQTAAVNKAACPEWLIAAAPAVRSREKALSPSDLGGAKVMPTEIDGMDEKMAMRRGSLIHLLLEHLPNKPEVDWERLSQSLMQRYDDKTDNAEMLELLDIVARVLKTDTLKPVFAPDALAEVNITAQLPELDGRQIYGTIDRLVISDNRITAVDFKSNRVVPETPSDTPIGLLRQMGAYLSALQQIYPDHEINIAILWTQNQKFMSLPHDIVIDALKATTTS
jgi:ATP-dependent helicase/nuclease subunit A